MNRYKIFTRLFGLAALTALLSACSQDKPEAIWNPQINSEGAPAIVRLEPDGTQFFPDMEIKIMGSNFSPVVEQNLVYFDNQPATILSASAEELVVQRPSVTGDSLTIKVIVKDQVIVAEYSPYKILPAVEELGRFTSANITYSIAVDKDENLYVFHKGPLIYKITPDNVKTEFCVPKSAIVDDMRMGPDGALYFAGKIDKTKTISKIPAGGGEEVMVVETKKTLTCVDFDKNGYLYAGGKKSGLVRVDINTGETVELDAFDLFYVYALKFTDTELYALASYDGTQAGMPESGIFKCAINPDGTFGPEMPVLDWATTGDYATYDWYGFTIAENGDLIIGTDHPNPLLVVSAGRMAPMYAGLLTPNADVVMWGNDTYLYVNRGSKGGGGEAGRIYRVRTTQKGVPYYGIE